MRRSIPLFVCLAMVCGLPSASAGVWYVDVDNASGVEDGTSWATAYTTIQPGIDASSTAGGGEVWVAEGDYALGIEMGSDTAVYGGFSGSEAALDERNVDAHLVRIAPPASASVRHVVVVSGVRNTLLDGLTISGGEAVFGYPDNTGGGVKFVDADETNSIVNCRITGNRADRGGGMSFTNSSPVVNDCLISENTAVYYDGDHSLDAGAGGGIYIENSSPLFTNCMIDGNSSGAAGGGVASFGSSARFLRCSFVNNKAERVGPSGNISRGGGIYCDEDSSTFEDCLITGNAALAASAYGGGTYCIRSTSVFKACVIARNRVEGASIAWGGGIANFRGALTIANCTIGDNTALGRGGGIYCWTDTSTIINSTISGNTSGNSGGGVFCIASASPTIINTTISGNTAENSGGGIYCILGTSVTIINATISGNAAELLGGGMYCETRTSTIVTNTIFEGNANYAIAEEDAEVDIVIEHCLFYGNPDGDYLYQGTTTYTDASIMDFDVPGARNNFSGEPLFVDKSAGDFHIQDGSYALDRGLSTVAPDKDFEGDLRPGGDGRVDIGVDESESSYTPTVYDPDPLSSVLPLPTLSRSPQFDVQWEARAAHLRIDFVRLFYRRDGGPWTQYPGSFDLSPIRFDTSITGGDGHYAFYTVATSLGGKVEPAPLVADASIDVYTYALGTTIYVDKNATGARTGENWDTALRSIQRGLDVARKLGVPKVWVAEGSYSESIVLADGISLYGGYGRAEKALRERDIEAHPTIIDGSSALAGESARHVVSIDRPVHYARLDGFTVTGGNADGGGLDGNGGGLFLAYADPEATDWRVVVANCRITGNTATHSGGGVYAVGGVLTVEDSTVSQNRAGQGGGIAAAARIHLTNCQVTENKAVSGGGLSLRERDWSSSAFLSGCTISDNHADLNGGGALIESGVSSEFENCTIARNSAEDGGGVYGRARIIGSMIEDNSAESSGGGAYGPSQITDSTIIRNTAGDGGGLYLNVGGSRYSPPVLNGCVISENTATARGGGVFSTLPYRDYVFGGIADCTISGNTASSGGGLYFTPFNYECYYYKDMENAVDTPAAASSMASEYDGGLSNSVIWGNAANQGSAIYCAGGYAYCTTTFASPRIVNCTIVGNSAGADGAAIAGRRGYPFIANTILAGNTGYAVRASPPNPHSYSALFEPIIWHSLFFDNSEGDYYDAQTQTVYTGGPEVNAATDNAFANISGDPLFVDAKAGDYHLQNGSAALDLGNPEYAPEFDFEGDPRPGEDGLVDMGADEAEGAFVPPPDTNPPTTRVLPLDTVATVLTPHIEWAPENGESDIQYVELYYRFNGGPWTLYPGRFETSPITFYTTLTGGDGFYEFYTVATDSANNVEVVRGEADAMTWVVAQTMGSHVYVDADAHGTQSGGSWANALTSLSVALLVAEQRGIPEIWVAEGRYFESISLVSNVALYGGFSGSESAFSERDVANNPTIIVGESSEDRYPGFPTILMDSVANVRVDGFTVTHNAESPEIRTGSGFRCNLASGTNVISNCRIVGNSSWNGGGIDCRESSLEVVDCTISFNSASGRGGGINCHSSDLTLKNCTISENTAQGAGGGLNGRGNLEDCVVKNNSAEDGGGITAGGIISGCIISHNVALDSGGGINIATKVVNCLVSDNTAPIGGGVFGVMTLVNCTVDGNSSERPHRFSRSDRSFATSTIFSNSVGSAVVGDWSFENCLFFNNPDGDYYCDFNDHDAQNDILYFGASSINASVEGSSNNIDGDPLFFDAAAGFHQLTAGSAAIDAGILDGAPEVDMRGVPRPQGLGVDIGAYEHAPWLLDSLELVDVEPAEGPLLGGNLVTVNVHLETVRSVGEAAGMFTALTFGGFPAEIVDVTFNTGGAPSVLRVVVPEQGFADTTTVDLRITETDDPANYSELADAYTYVLGYVDESEGGGEGEGEGEGEVVRELSLCQAFPAILDQLAEFRTVFWIESDDLDRDGLPDDFSLALMRYAACSDEEGLWGATLNAYHNNLLTLDEEAEILALAPYRELVAALMAVSYSMQEALRAALAGGDSPIVLTGQYVIAVCEGEDCFAMRFKGILTEPYSAQGDFDGDGVINRDEYLSAGAAGATLEDFIAMATDPELGESYSGEGEGEPSLCEAFAEVVAQFAQFRIEFGVVSDDLDEDGLPDDFAFALMESVACSENGTLLWEATLNAYAINLVVLDAEVDAVGLQPYRELVAALMAMSQGMQEALSGLLAAAENPIFLAGEYVSVFCDSAWCLPGSIKGLPLSEGYEVFSDFAKNLDEPYSGSGDLDGDGVSNRVEYDNIVAAGGVLSDFVDAAQDPDLDGSELSGEGPQCAAAPGSVGDPSGPVGDLLVLGAMLAILAVARRRRA